MKYRPNKDQIIESCRSGLAQDEDLPNKVQEMIDVIIPWLESHNVTFTVNLRNEWNVIGPDAATFPPLWHHKRSTAIHRCLSWFEYHV